jgi:hypothetical protein
VLRGTHIARMVHDSVMRTRLDALVLAATLLASPASVRGQAAVHTAAAPALAQPSPPGRGQGAQAEVPCAPVKPCEIPDEPAPEAEPAADFGPQARRLFDFVGCRGGAPASLDAKAVASFCAAQAKAIAAYRDGYLPKASTFLAGLRPASLPTAVVYPLGGDLLSALTSYPDARNITTLSLERAGDPRRLDALTPAEVRASLEVIRATSSDLLPADGSKAANPPNRRGGEIPGQLASSLIALAIHGYEPIGLRFFRVEPDGRLHYLTPSEIAALESESAKRLRGPGRRTPPDVPEAFSNSELVFVRKGEDPRTQARVHRHIAADLSNGALAKAPGPLRHLAAKGRFAAMTKAASYLLWRDDFSMVRDVLLAQMVFMISDSTGIPPRYARKAGFAQETYGSYGRAFLEANAAIDAEMVQLWASQPRRALPIRYGYVDGQDRYHLLVTKKQ